MDSLLILSIFHLILFVVYFFIRASPLFLFHVRERRREVPLYLHAQSKQRGSICGGVLIGYTRMVIIEYFRVPSRPRAILYSHDELENLKYIKVPTNLSISR